MNITKSSQKLSAATEIDAAAPRLSSTPPANGRARNPQPQRRWLAAIFTAFALLLAAGGAQAQATLDISSSATGTTATGVFTFTFAFGGNVNGFTSSDIVYSGELATDAVTFSNDSATFAAVSGSVYTVVVTPPSSANGTISVAVAATAADPPGNAVASASQLYDTSAPVFDSGATAMFGVGVATTVAVYTANANDNSTVTYSFGSGGDESLFSIHNATGIVRYLAVRDSAVVHNISIIATDAAGNDSTPQPVAITVGARPTLDITSDGAATATGAVTFTFRFGDDVSGFVVGGISLSGHSGPGSIVGTLGGSGAVYTLEVTPPSNDDGTISVSVLMDAATSDLGGAGNVAASATQAYDTSAPVFDSGATAMFGVGVATTVAVYTANANDNSTVTYSFGSGGDESLFSIHNATGIVRYLAVRDSAVVHNISIIATDAAGNDSTPQPVAITVGARPTLDITSDGAATATGAVTFTFRFGDDVSGFVVGGISLSGHSGPGSIVGTLGGSGAVYTLEVTPPSNDDGTISVSVLMDAATSDLGGAGNVAASATQDYDTSAPVFDSGATAMFGVGVATTVAVYTANANDNSTVTYSFGSGGDESLFSIHNATGIVRYLAVRGFCRCPQHQHHRHRCRRQ